MTALLPLLKANWKFIAGGAAILVAVVAFNIWLSGAKSAAYERGFEKAASDCQKAREAAESARQRQIEAIREEEARKLAEMEAERDAERARNAELDRKLNEANREAAIARREAERKTNDALENDGLAGFAITGRVWDNLADAMSAYAARHGQGIREGEAGEGEAQPVAEAGRP